MNTTNVCVTATNYKWCVRMFYMYIMCKITD